MSFTTTSVAERALDMVDGGGGCLEGLEVASFKLFEIRHGRGEFPL